MAYGVTNALDATSADMARGLRINWDQGKVELVEVFGDAAVKTAQLKPALT
jgi:hypothetical protein